MKQTSLIIFIFCICRPVFSFDNTKENNQLTATKTTISNNLERIESPFFPMDTLKQIPTDIKPLIKGKALKTFRVDFNGDGKPDFICQYAPTIQTDNADFLEDWITSDKKLYKTVKKYHMDFDFFWFVNLDSDPEPEIFSATGYVDGIDYAFYDQDFKTGEDKLLFYFNPVILENDEHYWGYPWDITSLILEYDSSDIYLRASIDHDIERDGNITIPDKTKTFPVIFFYGHTTQPDIKVEAIRNIKLMTLNQFK